VQSSAQAVSTLSVQAVVALSAEAVWPPARALTVSPVPWASSELVRLLPPAQVVLSPSVPMGLMSSVQVPAVAPAVLAGAAGHAAGLHAATSAPAYSGSAAAVSALQCAQSASPCQQDDSEEA
jgi:hypothetical protein